ncbi:alpha/beta fold hydrolase [Mycolicibacterium sp. 141076]|uniref:alpha/beta fold hydrolase n=1 Tax=Mycobacteriaceae TaxID=1762 RepID=UPI000F9738C4|nr:MULTISPECIES: alpha/beta fold hydrolase [unclassified Mycolicibacterium]MDX1880222.1 alpha/beta fold hydrolase [Mycolicibacterium sp. 141076]RUP32674.1 MAG: lipase [Mycolicibacterium sp.]
MNSRQLRRLVAAGLLAAVCLTAPACQSDPAPKKAGPPTAGGIDLKPDTTGAGHVPGALVSASTFPTLDLRLKSAVSLAARIGYTSTSGITGEHTEVSGSVFVPNGTPPPGGWPIIVFGHATSGVQRDCGPSGSSTLQGLSAPITTLVKAGYLVSLPDYQGLGPGTAGHPYADATTVGYNVIDSVRAAHKLVPQSSDRWLAVGVSQGGQAAWAANELAARYGTGLNLVGTVSLSPATDLTGLAAGAAAGSLSKEQGAILQLILASLATENPSLNLGDYRRGEIVEHWDVLASCRTEDAAARAAAIDKITPDDLRPASPQAEATLQSLLAKRSLPKEPTSAPMLVLYGGQDTLLPPDWTNKALAAACRLGDVIDIMFQPTKGHADIDVAMSYDWIKDRFDGVPAPNSCPSFNSTQGAGQ